MSDPMPDQFRRQTRTRGVPPPLVCVWQLLTTLLAIHSRAPSSWWACRALSRRVCIAFLSVLRLGLAANGQAAPVNDLFENRTRPDIGTTLIAGSLQGATFQTGEPSVVPDQIGGSVWFEWTCPASGRWTVETYDGRKFTWWAKCFTGTRLDDLTIPPSEDNRGQVFHLAQGDRLILQVVSRDASTGPFQIRLALPPVNDDFANRQFLTGEDASFPVDTFAATREPDEWGVEPPWGTTWFEWTAPSSGLFEILGVIDTPQLANVLLDVMQGTSATHLRFLRGAYYDYSGPSTRQSLGLRVTQDQSYLLRLRGYQTAAVNGSLYFRRAPAYNDFGSRKPVHGTSFEEAFYSVVDHGEPGEPTFGEFPPRGSAWWEWSCTVSGSYQLSSAQGIRVGVFAGATLDRLETRAFSEGGSVAFHAAAGERLILMTDNRRAHSAFGGTLRLEHTGSQDSFDRAIRITGVNITTHFPVLLPSREPGEPAASQPDIGSRWFRWMAPATGNFGMSMPSGNGSASLRVYRGETVSSLTLLAESAFTTNSHTQLNFPAEAGVDYSISIETPSRSDRAFSGIHVLHLAAAATNDAFEARQELPVTSLGLLYGVQGTTFGARTELREPPSGHGPDASTVWYRWIAPSNGWFHVSLGKGPASSTNALAVFRGNTLSELVPVPALRHRDSPTLEDYRFVATEGEAYAIRVTTPMESMRGFTIALAPSPTNDDIDHRRQLVGPDATDRGSLEGASAEDLDPAHLSRRGTVWWEWIAPEEGTCELKVESGSPGFEADISVTQILGTLPIGLVDYQPTAIDGVATLQIAVSAGHRYFVVVSGDGGPTGSTFTLRLRSTPQILDKGNWFPRDWNLTRGGRNRWFNQTAITRDGAEAIQASLDGDNAIGSLTTTVVGPGRMSFWWRVDAYHAPTPDYSESGTLSLRINGKHRDAILGRSDWVQSVVAIPEGTNVVSWEALGLSNRNATGNAWLSGIEFEPTSPLRHLQMISPAPGQERLVFECHSVLPYAIEISHDLQRWVVWIAPEALQAQFDRAWPADPDRQRAEFQVWPLAEGQSWYFRAIAR